MNTGVEKRKRKREREREKKERENTPKRNREKNRETHRQTKRERKREKSLFRKESSNLTRGRKKEESWTNCVCVCVCVGVQADRLITGFVVVLYLQNCTTCTRG